MIDTVRLKFPIAPEPDQLPTWVHQIRINPDGSLHEKYTHNVNLRMDQISVRCTYYPLDYEGKPMTTIELSLPKVVFGNNYTMIEDIPGAIAQANALLASDHSLPEVDFAQGELLRIDPCYNHQVGDRVPDYINAIGQLDYPHRRTKHHRNEGAEFRSQHVTTKFYDKQREARVKNAYGILRQEATYLDPKRIAKLLHTKHPTLRDITPEWIALTLTHDLAALRLEGRSIADRDTALVVLSHKYGPHAGMFYWGLLQAKLIKSKQQLAPEINLHPRSLDRRIKAIVDAGIAPTLTETTEPLPPLEIKL